MKLFFWCAVVINLNALLSRFTGMHLQPAPEMTCPAVQVYLALRAARAAQELDEAVLRQALHRSMDGPLLMLVERSLFAIQDAEGRWHRG
jgi:hypothetical protein